MNRVTSQVALTNVDNTMKERLSTIIALTALTATFAVACNEDAVEGEPQTIRETGYLSCVDGGETCPGALQCLPCGAGECAADASEQCLAGAALERHADPARDQLLHHLGHERHTVLTGRRLSGDSYVHAELSSRCAERWTRKGEPNYTPHAANAHTSARL